MTPGDQCRLSKLNLAIYNRAIFLLNPSKRKDRKGEVLAQICEKYSSRVCIIRYNPCARKIRNLRSLYSFVQESIQGIKISKSARTCSNPVKKHLQTPDPQISSRCYRL